MVSDGANEKLYFKSGEDLHKYLEGEEAEVYKEEEGEIVPYKEKEEEKEVKQEKKDKEEKGIRSEILDTLMNKQTAMTPQGLADELEYTVFKVRDVLLEMVDDGELKIVKLNGETGVKLPEDKEIEEKEVEEEEEPEGVEEDREPHIEDFIEKGKEKFKPMSSDRGQMRKLDEFEEEGIPQDELDIDAPRKEWIQNQLPLDMIGLPDKKPDWASVDIEPTEEELEDEIPICWIQKKDIRQFGDKVIGKEDSPYDDGLTQAQYRRVRDGLKYYREGRVSRVGTTEWKVKGSEGDVYLIRYIDGNYVHLDNYGRLRDWGQRGREEGLWCKHMVAVDIARKLDCEVDFLEVDEEDRLDKRFSA